MSLRTYMSKLNWRQIAAHLLATFFFMAAFYIFFNLRDTELISIIRTTTPEERLTTLKANGKSAGDLSYFVIWRSLSPFFGLLAAFIVSLIISLRLRWHWLNPLLVFVIGYLLHKIGLLGFGIDFIQMLTFRLGQLLNNIQLEFIVSGTVWLMIGCILFFNRKTFSFITNTSANRSFPK